MAKLKKDTEHVGHEIKSAEYVGHEIKENTELAEHDIGVQNVKKSTRTVNMQVCSCYNYLISYSTY